MSEDTPGRDTSLKAPARARTARPKGFLRWALAAGAVICGLVILIIVALLSLNTAPGRAFLVDRLEAYEAESGLNFRIGRIDGSIFGRMQIHDLQIRDGQGPFVVVPLATIEWRPVSLLRRRIELREVEIPTVRMLRKPALEETPPDPDKSLLPNIDIAAPKVRVSKIIFEQAVTGRRHVANLSGSADLADGRARVDLRAAALQSAELAGGDRLRIFLDVVPDANRLIADIQLNAPAGGLVDSYLRLNKPLAISLDGRGDWAAWRGQARAQLGETPLVRLDLSARDGLFRIAGQVQAASLLQGSASRLLEPAVTVTAQGTLVQRRLEGRVDLRSRALVVNASGLIDLEANRLRSVGIKAQLLEPGALAENLTGRDVRLNLDLAGRFSRLVVSYQLSAAAVGIGDIDVERLTAAGRTRISSDRILIPIQAKAARVTGLNAAAGGLLTNLTLTGDLAISGGQILSDNLRLRSDRIDATAVIAANLKTGQYTGALKGRVNDYAIEGIGRFNLVTDAKLTTGRTGGFGLRGSVRVNSRKIDNGALEDLLGGQGVLTANVELKPSGDITVAGLRLTAPDFQILSGDGVYSPDGRIAFKAAARSTKYGPLSLIASGTAQNPTLRLIAAAPDVGVPLRNVVVDVVGVGGAFRTQVRGSSPYGAFVGRATIIPETPLTIDVSSFQIAGVTLSGRISQTQRGPFSGALQVSGSGLDGALRLSAAGDVQKVDIDLTARQARLALDRVITIGAGQLTATALLLPRGPQVSGDLSVSDLRRGELVLTAARLRGRYEAGDGELGLVARGRSGVPFNVAVNARLSPRLIRASLEGAIQGQRIRLASPAEISKTREGWRLNPTRLLLPQGELLVSGQIGGVTEISARLRNVDLGISQTFNPQLALEGSASGIIDMRLPGGSGVPTIKARLNVDNFSRVGLATESPPVDIVLRGDLSGTGGDLQALIRRGGATIGRLQARMTPLGPGTGSWMERVLGAPLAGGVRYSGPTDVLWAMTGISGHELSGPIAIAADFGGRLRQPTLNGVIRADALRYENPTYATVISNIAVRGRFTQSRLEITSLTGRAGRGAVTARGWVGLDAAAGFPMDIRATLDEAQLASSDAIGARVSGTLAVTNSRRAGALIEGELRIPEARYRIVRQGAAQVPVLEGVRRRGSPAPVAAEPARQTAARSGPPANWRLNIRIRADNRLFVSGMGLESEWAANLRVRGTASSPTVTGDLDLVRGTYSFAGRRLELTQAEVRFDGVQATNPLIELVASTTVEGVTASVNVTGRAQNPQINFTSTPVLPQDEVLSRLLFGSSVGQLSPTQALQVAAALNSLRNSGGGLNPLGKLRAAAGVDRLRILGADEDSGRGTALAAGAYLSRDVYIEVITDARGFTATQLEIALSRTLSLLTQTSTFGGSRVELQYSRDY